VAFGYRQGKIVVVRKPPEELKRRLILEIGW